MPAEEKIKRAAEFLTAHPPRVADALEVLSPTLEAECEAEAEAVARAMAHPEKGA